MGWQVSLNAILIMHLVLSLINSVAVPVLDNNGRVIAILAGRPKNETESSWRTVHDEALQAMLWGQKQASFTNKQLSHRRGKYPALSTGASFGGGQKVCLYLIIAGHGLNLI